MQRIRTLALAVLVSCTCLSIAHAHGGSFTGPGGGGTPEYDGPAGGPTPGPGPGPGPGGGGNPPGGETGGDHGGTTGGSGGPVGPVRPGGASGRNGGQGRGGVTRRGKKSSGPTYTNWDWWWDLNQERFLNLKHAVRSRAQESIDRDGLIDVVDDGMEIAEVTLRQIRAEILPTLALAVKDGFYDTRAAAVIALGKVGSGSHAELAAIIQAAMKDDDKRVRESCCLGLGILGDPRSVPLLLSIARNDPETARRVLGRTEILPRTRTFASVAIGLIGHRARLPNQDVVVDALLEMARTKVRNIDVALGAALALQFIKSEAHLPAILEAVMDERLDTTVRAHLIVGLGKTQAESAVPLLVKLLGHKHSPIAHSATIALGLLADKEDARTVKALRQQAEHGRDLAQRHFALIALGEIGSTAGRATLVRMLERGTLSVRTFAALGLGVMGFQHGTDKADSAARVQRAWKSSKNELERSAYAVALGLLDHQAVAPELREQLDRGGFVLLKTHACTALGLLGDRSAIPQIRKLAHQRGDPDLRRGASVALGLLRDAGAVDVLRQVIEESKASKGILGAATVALGYVGDRSAVPVLTEFFEPAGGHQNMTRAFAAVALGFLGDKDSLPLLSLLHENSNFLAQTGALAELLTIL